MNRISHWIDGAVRASTGEATQAVYNPASGETIAQLELGSVADVDTAVASAAALGALPRPASAQAVKESSAIIAAECGKANA